MTETMTPPAEVAKKVTSHDIKIGLRASLAQGYQVFFEVGNNTGSKVTRHADAVAIGIWPSTGHQIHGYEIKVSRGDFLDEMKNPQKSWPVMRYCHRWSLLTPPGLVKVDELPPNWGLSTFDGKSIRSIRHAPMLAPEPISPGFVAALVRRAGDMDGEIIAAAQEKTRRELEAGFKQRLDHKLSIHRDEAAREGAEAIEIVSRLKAGLGDDYLATFQIPELVATVKAVRKMRLTGNHGGGLQRLCEDLLDADARIRRFIGDAGIEFDETVSEHRAKSRADKNEVI